MGENATDYAMQLGDNATDYTGPWSSNSCQRQHPEFCAEVTWEKVGWPLIIWPLCTDVVLTLFAMPVLRFIWFFCRDHFYGKWKLFHRFVGDVQDPRSGHHWLLTSFLVAEMLSSFWFSTSWVVLSYRREVDQIHRIADGVTSSVFFITYFLNAARYQFSVVYALLPGSICTVFTVWPVFIREHDGSNAWFSFGYFRIYNAVVAWERIQRLGVLQGLSEVHRSYIIVLLQLIALVVIFACTIFNLEILGDPEGWGDSLISTEMGELSFLQMVYWIFTTISTVGYGDFSPTTGTARLFIIVVIAGGCTFFSIKATELVEQHRLQDSGRGRYIQMPEFLHWMLFHTEQRGHVVLVGGGIREMSSLIRPLLSELLGIKHAAGYIGWPNISFLSMSEQHPELTEIIQQLPYKARSRISYFVGDPMNPHDLERVQVGRATMVIVVASFHSHDIDQEDQNNIMRAMAIMNAFPQTNLRLTLLRPANKITAVRVGITPHRCFSISEMKSHIFALSLSCRGWSSMVTNLATTDSAVVEEDFFHVDDWASEYRKGCEAHISGFLPAEQYVGRTFVEFAREVALAGVMLLGVQINGRIQLNPFDHILQEKEVVFALTPSKEALHDFADGSEDWRRQFLQMQSDESLHFLSATLIRHETQRTRMEQLLAGRRSSQVKEETWKSSNTNISTMINYDDSGLDSQVRSPPRAKSGHHHPESNDHGRHRQDHSTGRLQRHSLSHREEAEAQAMANRGDHYILVVLTGSPWQQIRLFLQALRSEHLPFVVPILVLSPSPVLDEKDRLKVTNGASDVCLKFVDKKISSGGHVVAASIMNDLLHAGLLKARGIVLFGGNAGDVSTADHRFFDGMGVTLLSSIEVELLRAQKRGVPIILELHHQAAAACLSRFPLGEGMHNDTHRKSKQKHNDFATHPRFASGTVFAPNFLGALLAKAYYTPGIVELLGALVMGTQVGHTQQPWQVALPEDETITTYGELVQYYLSRDDPVLCLGLYRKCWPDIKDSQSFYVATCPHPSTMLEPIDLAIVVGSFAFGQWSYDQKLIPGAWNATAVPNSNAATEANSNVATERNSDAAEGSTPVAQPQYNSEAEAQSGTQNGENDAPEEDDNIETLRAKLRRLQRKLDKSEARESELMSVIARYRAEKGIIEVDI